MHKKEEVIKINLPDGWKQLKEGIIICANESDWCDQDMWWAENDQWWIDVGTYNSDRKEYVCLALRKKPFREHVDFSEAWAKKHELDADEVFPDWRYPDEKVEFDTAPEVVAWVYGWLEKISGSTA